MIPRVAVGNSENRKTGTDGEYPSLRTPYGQSVPAKASGQEHRTTGQTLVRAFSNYTLLIHQTRLGHKVQPTRLTMRQRKILHDSVSTLRHKSSPVNCRAPDNASPTPPSGLQHVPGCGKWDRACSSMRFSPELACSVVIKKAPILVVFFSTSQSAHAELVDLLPRTNQARNQIFGLPSPIIPASKGGRFGPDFG